MSDHSRDPQVDRKQQQVHEGAQPESASPALTPEIEPGAINPFQQGRVEAQAASIQRLPPGQRHAAMQRINRVQGNRHAQRLVASLKPRTARPTPQLKLTVSEPGDSYEQEADRVADQVMRDPVGAAPPTPPGDGSSGDDPTINRSVADPVAGAEVDSKVQSRIQDMQGSGKPLPKSDRTFFESRMNADFSNVRIHDDANAAETARDLDARAYTVGSDVAFDRGEYTPGTQEGRRLLAHELTHVVQQGGAGELQRTSQIQRKALSTAEAVAKAQETLTPSDVAAEEEIPLAADPPAIRDVEIPDAGGGAGTPGGGSAPASGAAAGETKKQSEGAPKKKKGIAGAEEAAAPQAAEPLGAPAAAAPAAAAPKGAAPSGNGKDPSGAGKGPAAAGPAPQAQAPASEAAQAPPAAAAPAAAAGGDRAPASPEEDPGFQAVATRSEGVAQEEQTHAPAGSKSAEAQAAADPQGSDVEMAAQDRQVGEIEQEQPQEFNPEAFMDQVMEKIEEAAPDTLKEAEDFDGSELNEAKSSVTNEVAEEKQEAEGPIEEKTEETPDTAGIAPKPVESLPPAEPGAQPGPIGAEQAAPKPKGHSEVEAPVQQEAKSLDNRMAEAKVTEEQLEKSNEPEFQTALDAKKEAQTHAEESPQEYRAQEGATLDQAQNESTATAGEGTAQMHDERAQLMQEVFGLQGEAKTEDEAERKKVADEIADIYEETKEDVTKIFDDLDGWVSDKFEEGANAAKDEFVSEAKRRVRNFKLERYLIRPDGAILWLQDQFKEPPAEIEAIFQDERSKYVQAVERTLWQIAEHVSAELNRAKARVTEGRQEIQEYVASLDPELQDVGKQAAQDIDGKFDELEQSVHDKQAELIDNLADQYNTKLQEVDAEIEQMREANKGLVKKAEDALGGVIETIMELKDTLVDMFNRAAGAVEMIIQDPIKFLGNLLEGIKMGFQQFVSNIGQHLQSALVGWLTGTLGPVGITLPETWDLKGIFSLVLQVLGLTWENIRTQIVTALGPKGEEIMSALESVWEVIQIIRQEGLAGLWEYIKEKIGDLKAMVIDEIKNMVIQQVIQTGVDWLISMLGGPAGAFVKAVQSIVRVVKWFVENAGRIASLVNSIIDSVTNIASGNLQGAANFIENSLSQALPTVIGFLADLLGLGGVADKIQGVIKKIRAPINKAIQWLVKQAKAMVKKVGRLLGFGKDDEKDKKGSPDSEKTVSVLRSEDLKILVSAKTTNKNIALGETAECTYNAGPNGKQNVRGKIVGLSNQPDFSHVVKGLDKDGIYKLAVKNPSYREKILEYGKMSSEEFESLKNQKRGRTSLMGDEGEESTQKTKESQGFTYINLNSVKSNFGGIDGIAYKENGKIEFIQSKCWSGPSSVASHIRRERGNDARKAAKDLFKCKSDLQDLVNKGVIPQDVSKSEGKLEKYIYKNIKYTIPDDTYDSLPKKDKQKLKGVTERSGITSSEAIKKADKSLEDLKNKNAKGKNSKYTK